MFAQLDRGFQLLLFLAVAHGGYARVSLARVKQLCQRLTPKVTLVLQVAPGDQVPLWMVVQPPLTIAQQLVHFVVANPVVLVVVQHGQQHVEVRQQIPEPHFRGEFHAEIWAGSPFREPVVQFMRLNRNAITQRLEQTPDEVGAFAGRYDFNPRLQRDGLVCQGRTILAGAGQRAPEHGSDCHAQV